MYIIIDGYNLLKRIAPTLEISELQRTALVNLLGRYILKRGHKITIVFDGGSSAGPVKERQKGVGVIFSGYQSTADDVIIGYVQAHYQKEIMVVTADREICMAVKEYGAESVDPELFYEKVKAAFFKPTEEMHKDAGVIKLSQDHNPELDALMHQGASFIKGAKSDEQDYWLSAHQQPKSQQISKKEKNKSKKIDKL